MAKVTSPAAQRRR